LRRFDRKWGREEEEFFFFVAGSVASVAWRAACAGGDRGVSGIQSSEGMGRPSENATGSGEERKRSFSSSSLRGGWVRCVEGVACAGGTGGVGGIQRFEETFWKG
jgi:hypothetical protein